MGSWIFLLKEARKEFFLYNKELCLGCGRKPDIENKNIYIKNNNFTLGEGVR